MKKTQQHSFYFLIKLSDVNTVNGFKAMNEKLKEKAESL